MDGANMSRYRSALELAPSEKAVVGGTKKGEVAWVTDRFLPPELAPQTALQVVGLILSLWGIVATDLRGRWAIAREQNTFGW